MTDDAYASKDAGESSTDDCSDAQDDNLMIAGNAPDELDPIQLRQYINSLKQKLERQKAKPGSVIFNESQQRQLLELLDEKTASDSDHAIQQLQSLLQRGMELNQRSEKIQKDIQSLNIVSENATSKCFEISYSAKNFIDENSDLQKDLNQQLERTAILNQECDELVEKLNQQLEQSFLTQQKMDSATDRALSANEKSNLLLGEFNQFKQDIAERILLMCQVGETSKRSISESRSIHKSLELLKQQIGENLGQHRQQMETCQSVLSDCRQRVEEVDQGRQETERVLNAVMSGNTENDALIARMKNLLQVNAETQSRNGDINLELQHSLQLNQQQREEVTVLASECREARDEAIAARQNHDATARESLAKLSAAEANSKQGRLQIDRILQQVTASHLEGKELSERMSELTAASETRQQENNELNAELQQVLQQHSSSRDELEELVYDCRVVRDKTTSVLETSEQLNSDSQASIVQLNQTVSATRQDLKQLTESTNRINADANESLDSLRTCIDDSTLIQEQCIRVNKESISATLEAKSSTQKLAEELESSMKVNQHYQERLKLAEKKYLDASKAQKEYQELHDSSLLALRENEAMLEQARATIKDYSDNSVEYTNSIKQFQQTTIQSQQIILDTQATIKSLLASNEQLTEENRFLKTQGPQRESVVSTKVWPSLDTELQADAKLSSELDLAQDKHEDYKEEWHLD